MFKSTAMIERDRFVMGTNLSVKKTKVALDRILPKYRSGNERDENLVDDRPDKKPDDNRYRSVIAGYLPRTIAVIRDDEGREQK